MGVWGGVEEKVEVIVRNSSGRVEGEGEAVGEGGGLGEEGINEVLLILVDEKSVKIQPWRGGGEIYP